MKNFQFQETLQNFSLLVTAKFGILWLLTYLANWIPVADSLSNFRFQIMLGVFFSLLVSLILKMRILVLLNLVFLLLCIIFYFSNSHGFEITEQTQRQLSVYQHNMRFDNKTPGEVVEDINNLKPDIVLLQEVSGGNKRALKPLFKEYASRVFCHFKAIGSVAILSRFPLLKESVCIKKSGWVEMEISAFGINISLVSIHLEWPYPFKQKEHVARFNEYIKGKKDVVIIAGDFNAAGWTETLQSVEKASSTKIVPGVRFSFQKSGLLSRFFPLPLDHLLHTHHFSIINAELRGHMGSDHRAVSYDLLIEDF